MRRPLWTPRWGQALRKQTGQPLRQAHTCPWLCWGWPWVCQSRPDTPCACVMARGTAGHSCSLPPQHSTPKAALQPRGALESPSAFLENPACSKVTRLSRIRPGAGHRGPAVGAEGRALSPACSVVGLGNSQWRVYPLIVDGPSERSPRCLSPKLWADAGVAGRAWHGCPISRTLWTLRVFPGAV